MLQGSPSTKRRGQMLQPIIEGETAHFFEEIKVCTIKTFLKNILPSTSNRELKCFLY